MIEVVPLEEIVRQAALRFSQNRAGYTIKRNDITFHQVGRNASHEFFLGTDGSKLFKIAIYDEEYEDENGEWQYEVNETFYEINPDESYYLGHL